MEFRNWEGVERFLENKDVEILKILCEDAKLLWVAGTITYDLDRKNKRIIYMYDIRKKGTMYVIEERKCRSVKNLRWFETRDGELLYEKQGDKMNLIAEIEGIFRINKEE